LPEPRLRRCRPFPRAAPQALNPFQALGKTKKKKTKKDPKKKGEEGEGEGEEAEGGDAEEGAAEAEGPDPLDG